LSLREDAHHGDHAEEHHAKHGGPGESVHGLLRSPPVARAGARLRRRQEVRASSSALIFGIRLPRSIGFVSKSSQPAASALSRSWAMACAVRAMTGTAFVSGAALS